MITVKELIEKLQKCDQNAVVFSDDSEYNEQPIQLVEEKVLIDFGKGYYTEDSMKRQVQRCLLTEEEMKELKRIPAVVIA